MSSQDMPDPAIIMVSCSRTESVETETDEVTGTVETSEMSVVGTTDSSETELVEGEAAESREILQVIVAKMDSEFVEDVMKMGSTITIVQDDDVSELESNSSHLNEPFDQDGGGSLTSTCLMKSAENGANLSLAESKSSVTCVRDDHLVEMQFHHADEDHVDQKGSNLPHTSSVSVSAELTDGEAAGFEYSGRYIRDGDFVEQESQEGDGNPELESGDFATANSVTEFIEQVEQEATITVEKIEKAFICVRKSEHFVETEFQNLDEHLDHTHIHFATQAHQLSQSLKTAEDYSAQLEEKIRLLESKHERDFDGLRDELRMTLEATDKLLDENAELKTNQKTQSEAIRHYEEESKRTTKLLDEIICERNLLVQSAGDFSAQSEEKMQLLESKHTDEVNSLREQLQIKLDSTEKLLAENADLKADQKTQSGAIRQLEGESQRTAALLSDLTGERDRLLLETEALLTSQAKAATDHEAALGVLREAHRRQLSAIETRFRKDLSVIRLAKERMCEELRSLTEQHGAAREMCARQVERSLERLLLSETEKSALQADLEAALPNLERQAQMVEAVTVERNGLLRVVEEMSAERGDLLNRSEALVVALRAAEAERDAFMGKCTSLAASAKKAEEEWSAQLEKCLDQEASVEERHKAELDSVKTSLENTERAHLKQTTAMSEQHRLDQTQLEAVQICLLDAESTVSAMKAEMAALTAQHVLQCDALAAELSTAKDKFSIAETALLELQNSYADLQTECETLRARIEASAGVVSLLDTQIKALTEEREEHRSKQLSQQHEVKELSQQLSTAVLQLSTSEKVVQGLQQNLATVQTENEKLTACLVEGKALTDTVTELKAKIQSLTDQARLDQTELERAKSSLLDAQSATTSMSDEMASLTAQHQRECLALTEKLSSATAFHLSVSEQSMLSRRTLQSENETLIARIAEAEAVTGNISLYQSEIKTLTEQRDEALRRGKDLSQRLDASEQLKNDTMDQMAGLTLQNSKERDEAAMVIAGLREKLSASETVFADLEAARNQCQALRLLQEEMAAKEAATLSALTEEVRLSQEQLVVVTEERDAVQDQLGHVTDHLIEAETAKVKLENEMEEWKRERAVLLEQVEEFQRQMLSASVLNGIRNSDLSPAIGEQEIHLPAFLSAAQASGNQRAEFLFSDNDHLNVELEQVIDRLASSQDEKRELEHRLMNLVHEHDVHVLETDALLKEARASHAHLEIRVKDLVTQNADMISQLVSFKEKLVTTEKRHLESEQALGAIVTERDNLQAETLTLRRELAEVAASEANLKDRLCRVSVKIQTGMETAVDMVPQQRSPDAVRKCSTKVHATDHRSGSVREMVDRLDLRRSIEHDVVQLPIVSRSAEDSQPVKQSSASFIVNSPRDKPSTFMDSMKGDSVDGNADVIEKYQIKVSSEKKKRQALERQLSVLSQTCKIAEDINQQWEEAFEVLDRTYEWKSDQSFDGTPEKSQPGAQRRRPSPLSRTLSLSADASVLLLKKIQAVCDSLDELRIANKDLGFNAEISSEDTVRLLWKSICYAYEEYKKMQHVLEEVAGLLDVRLHGAQRAPQVLKRNSREDGRAVAVLRVSVGESDATASDGRRTYRTHYRHGHGGRDASTCGTVQDVSTRSYL
ncbi:hypothetical protein BV898_12682 [Hypsibius exemplaris]|uniref:Uncharacterized protein n=1 Tax=Hypsibius exemplaris TaxID=2072580 RepID=A0A1W0WCT0_HYPEX|nr:hypothetical protein BV898_12682 [Hypsibius exemplaris]